jgi:hypothetical protein
MSPTEEPATVSDVDPDVAVDDPRLLDVDHGSRQVRDQLPLRKSVTT